MIIIKTLKKDCKFILNDMDTEIVIELCARLEELNLKEINKED